MTVAFATPERTGLGVAEGKALASEIIARTGPGEAFNAAAILEEHPDLAGHRSVVIDLAYEEFCRRIDAGESPDPREFAQRFPGVAQSLLHVLEVHQYLDHHPDAFAAEPSPEWPQAGEEFSGFALVREIGRGGFSRVFLARERELGNREVVVKICRQANDEAARLGQLDHPHIVPVYSVQTQPDSGVTIICMPYLGSATLADVLAEAFAGGGPCRRGADVLRTIARADARHSLPGNGGFWNQRPKHWTLRRGSYAEAIVESGAELCEALAYAHSQGICHCDVKPSNVLLTSAGRSLLLDFNLSMQRGGAAAIVGGTLPYMAPEQLRFVLAASTEGLPPIDQRADIFSLGVTLFQLLTGHLPFPADEVPGSRREAAHRLLEQQRCRRGLQDELERVASPRVARVISECLAFDRDDRPRLAEHVARRLRDELRPLPRVRRWVRLHKVGVAIAALVLGFLAFAVGRAALPPPHLDHYQTGAACLEAGDFAAARRCLDHALEARPDFSPALLLRGWANLKAAQHEGRDAAERSRLLNAAYQDFDAGWQQTESAEWAASLACCCAHMGNLPEAKYHFDKVVQLGLSTPAVLNDLGYGLVNHLDHYQTGVACLEAGDFATASRCCDQALDAGSDFWQALLLRAWADLKASQDERLDASERSRLLSSAQQDCDASWTQTENAESAASLAHCFTQMGKFFEAQVYFKEAVERGLSTPAVLNNLGYCLKQTREDLAAAAGHLAKAIQRDPLLQAAHHNLAIVERELACVAVTKAELTKAELVRARGHSPDAARLKMAEEEFESEAADHIRSSVEHIESARNLEPRSAYLELEAARVYARAATLLRGNSVGADAREGTLLEKALRSCQAAVELHLPPDKLEEIAVLAPKLATHPAFRQLKSVPPSVDAPPPTPPNLLADVYPSVRDRLLAVSR